MAGLFNKADTAVEPEVAVDRNTEIVPPDGYNADVLRTYTTPPSNIFIALEKVNKEIERAISNANTLQDILGK